MFISMQYFSANHKEMSLAFRVYSWRKAPNYDTIKCFYSL